MLRFGCIKGRLSDRKKSWEMAEAGLSGLQAGYKVAKAKKCNYFDECYIRT